MDKKIIIVYALLVFTSLSWAGSFIAVRVVYQEVPPVILGFLRFAVATPLMLLVAGLKKKPFLLPKKEIPRLIILGLTGVTLLYIFQFLGIAYTTASTAAVLINTNVLFIALFSAMFLHERFNWKKTLGILLSFTGVILVVIGQMNNEALNIDTTFLLGCGLVICSAMCWAVYTIVGKQLLKTYDSVTITTHAFLFGTVLYIPVVLPSIGSVLSEFSSIGWIAIVYLGVVCSIFAYIAWYYALSRFEAAQSAVFLNLIPLFTILLSFFIGEYPTAIFILGAVFIMYGVYLTQKSRVKKT
jgi:drug/metabolite transporter (DMT)-like permease